MSMYSAEEVNARIDSFHGHPLTVAERAELFCMAREYAALLRERESAKAAVTDEMVIRMARALEQAGWATGGDFEDDFLPDVRAALEAIAPHLASARVPEELTTLLSDMVSLHDRRQCVLTVHMERLKDLLAAAPKPEKE